MNVVVIVAFFAAAFGVTIRRGGGMAFAYVYLPALIFFSNARRMQLPGFPDVTAPSASVLAILVAGIFWRTPRIRISICDGIFVSILCSYVATAVLTSADPLWAGISAFGNTLLELVAPYFVVRFWLQDKRSQRAALNVLLVASVAIAFFALVEARLHPNFYERVLHSVGIADLQPGYVERRFGIFRARAMFVHPIDLGISAGLVGAMIFLLALRTGVATRSRVVRAALGACLVGSLCGVSFSSLFGVVAGIVTYVGLAFLPFTRRFIPAGVMAAIAGAYLVSAALVNAPLPEPWEVETTFAGSQRTRQLILQLGWEAAATSGPFGLGATIDLRPLGLESVDNAYLLMTIQRGWVALVLWLSVAVALAFLVSRALRSARSETEARALLAGFAGVSGTMVAMFTVWFGFVYPSLFVILIALTVGGSHAQLAAARARRVRGKREPDGRPSGDSPDPPAPERRP